jgi:hypothetical protein
MGTIARNILKRLLKIEESVCHVVALEEGWTEIQWCLPNGILHREFGPAIENDDGLIEWWYRGYLHREDGPARKLPNGTEEYYCHGHQCKTLSEVRRKLMRQLP